MKTLWWNKKKYPKRTYHGLYRYVNGEREFCLSCVERKHVVAFESPQMAKTLGWSKK